jgi:4-amino-4-deoxychorismate mutase
MSGLDPFRRRLDVLDERIARLLGERFDVCREVACYKSRHGIAMMQPGRVAEVRARYLARGAEVNLPESFTSELFELLIGATCQMEDELMGTPESERVARPQRPRSRRGARALSERGAVAERRAIAERGGLSERGAASERGTVAERGAVAERGRLVSGIRASGGAGAGAS